MTTANVTSFNELYDFANLKAQFNRSHQSEISSWTYRTYYDKFHQFYQYSMGFLRDREKRELKNSYMSKGYNEVKALDLACSQINPKYEKLWKDYLDWEFEEKKKPWPPQCAPSQRAPTYTSRPAPVQQRAQPPPPSRIWPVGVITSSETVNINYSFQGQSGLVKKLDITYIITIYDNPNLYWPWFCSGFPDGQIISQLASSVESQILNNQPVPLSSGERINGIEDYRRRDILNKVAQIVSRPPECQWKYRCFDKTGPYLEVTLTNDNVLRLYYAQMIALCEYPDEFKKWVSYGKMDLNDESFLFAKRSKEHIVSMIMNTPIETKGELSRITRRLISEKDLQSIEIVELATLYASGKAPLII